ncbi:MAG: exodeoxyribonuclease VII large subunit [Kiritimatiellia bacterium]|nr:exodeoxyribonuclease VII large subunit [Kiritimatiellia bacterium]MDP6630684.1 exodeoxyribonuclease VII large subunit [Kiritimatiellia bacterium]MDP6809453.1 exodeoxyribonuclease VII large subunit [Kiritimatiellia bacterium]MDP7023870.1 exodeoxyribonuclease VII large subunit [Kiritimatiellia bacterium]
MTTAATTGAKQANVLSVTALTRMIKQTLERSVGSVWVEGEISNVRRPASGHYYFTIKDANAQISAVLFRGNQRNLAFQLKDGLQVRAQGDVSVYERSGSYQVIVRRLEESGVGALQAKFEELKKRLNAEGLFAAERKQALPLLPQHVGVVTSPTGAAIRDILNVISRRFPNIHLVLAPAMVQGPGAAQQVASGIEQLNQQGGLDVLIVGRGGGSLEDLWCFNEEIVARAIAASRIPVISAVGHEIDFTISDFVADLRAPTPSAAAELVVGRKDEFTERLNVLQETLTTRLRESVLRARHRLSAAQQSYVFREPRNLVRQHMQRLDSVEIRMGHAMSGQLTQGRQRLQNAGTALQHAIVMRSERTRATLDRFSSQLRMLSPLAVLDRGYSMTTDAQGRVLQNVDDVEKGDRLTTRFGKGAVVSVVDEIDKEAGNGS